MLFYDDSSQNKSGDAIVIFDFKIDIKMIVVSQRTLHIDRKFIKKI